MCLLKPSVQCFIVCVRVAIEDICFHPMADFFYFFAPNRVALRRDIQAKNDDVAERAGHCAFRIVRT